MVSRDLNASPFYRTLPKVNTYYLEVSAYLGSTVPRYAAREHLALWLNLHFPEQKRRGVIRLITEKINCTASLMKPSRAAGFPRLAFPQYPKYGWTGSC
jgi:hypothetical protein